MALLFRFFGTWRSRNSFPFSAQARVPRIKPLTATLYDNETQAVGFPCALDLLDAEVACRRDVDGLIEAACDVGSGFDNGDGTEL